MSELIRLQQELTSFIPITTTVPSTMTIPYATITSVIGAAVENQVSAISALMVQTNSISTLSLANDVLQAQATLNYYKILEKIATVTDNGSKASLMTQAVEASEIMQQIFDENAFYSGHYPSMGGNVALLVVFAVFLCVHIISAVFYHQWWFLTCWSSGLALEVLGYIGRVWSSQNIMNFDAYVMQIVCLTLGPCFLMAGVYYIIAQLTLIFGQKFSVLRPMQYSLTFILCDIISIILQACGGGVAAGALSVLQSTRQGANIMVGGLAFQVFTIGLFQLFWYIFLWRVYRSYKQHGHDEFNPDFAHIRSRKLFVPFICGVSFSVVLIFVRSIYRVVELAEGWSSKLAVDEIYFMILEGLMMSLACFVLTLLTPGVAYGRHSHIYVDKSLKATFSKHHNSEEFKSNEKEQTEVSSQDSSAFENPEEHEEQYNYHDAEENNANGYFQQPQQQI